MTSPLLLGPLLFASCTKGFDDIVLTGTLYDGEESASAPVSGADLQIRDADGSKGEHTTTAYDGVFQVEISPEQAFTAVFSADGSAETSFAATAGLGDIGEHFPDTDPRWMGADSLALLRDAAAKVRLAGWRVGNVDCSVVCEEPRLAPRRAEMQARLSAAAGGPVTVKGRRAEGLGALGRGEGIACWAVAVIVRTSGDGRELKEST